MVGAPVAMVFRKSASNMRHFKSDISDIRPDSIRFHKSIFRFQNETQINLRSRVFKNFKKLNSINVSVPHTSPASAARVVHVTICGFSEQSNSL